MNTSKQKNPTWWNDKHSSSWDRVKDAFARDWDQTKADFSKKKGHELKQNVADTVKQAAGKEPIPSPTTPNPKAEKQTKHDYRDAEPALRYGYGASSQYASYKDWDTSLEGEMRKEWEGLQPSHSWDDAKLDIRKGWERARKQS